MKVHYSVYTVPWHKLKSNQQRARTVHRCVIAQTHSRNEFRVPLSSGYCSRYFTNSPASPARCPQKVEEYQACPPLYAEIAISSSRPHEIRINPFALSNLAFRLVSRSIVNGVNQTTRRHVNNNAAIVIRGGKALGGEHLTINTIFRTE